MAKLLAFSHLGSRILSPNLSAATDTAQLCQVSDNMDLSGRLGLKEWVQQALQPVRAQLLYAGYHPKPQSSPPSTPGKASAPTPPAAPADTTKPPNFAAPLLQPCTPAMVAERTNQINTYLLAAENKLSDPRLVKSQADPRLLKIQAQVADLAPKENSASKSASSNISKEAQTLNTKVKQSAPFAPVLEPYVRNQINFALAAKQQIVSQQSSLAEIIKVNLDRAKDNADVAAQTVLLARKQISAVRNALAKADSNCTALDDIIKNSKTALETAKAAGAFADTAERDMRNAKENNALMSGLVKAMTQYVDGLRPIDPPISTIGQSIQFILAFGGNVTPTWTFVTFKGPTAPLFSGRLRALIC